MKPKNFPKRKLERRLKVKGEDPKRYSVELNDARNTKTKKNRAKK